MSNIPSSTKNNTAQNQSSECGTNLAPQLGTHWCYTFVSKVCFLGHGLLGITWITAWNALVFPTPCGGVTSLQVIWNMSWLV